MATTGALIDYILITLFSTTTIILIIGLKVPKENRLWTKTLDYVSLATGGVLLLKTIYMALKQLFLHS